MTGLALSPTQLIIIGIPQAFLIVFGISIFSKIKIEAKKYIILSLFSLISTYLVRLMPVAIGVNTMLSLVILILGFQVIYRFELRKIVSIIISMIGVTLIITFSELIDGVLLNTVFGQTRAHELTASGSSLVRSLSFVPSNIIFAIILFISYLVIRKTEKNKKDKNGKVSEKTGE